MASGRMRNLRALALFATVLLAVAGGLWGGHGWAAQGSLLQVAEGIVVDLGETAAEGGLQSVMIRLQGKDVGADLVLAPASVLEQVGFEVEKGDKLRARFFAPDPGEPAKVQKVMNVSKGLMVRLRTLHRQPLWDGSGDWQGAARDDRGGRAPRQAPGKGTERGTGPGGR